MILIAEEEGSIERKIQTVSVLGQDQGCTVKYSPRPEVTPEGVGLYLTLYLELIPNKGSKSFLRIIMPMITS